MPDPLRRLDDEAQRKQLSLLRTYCGETIQSTRLADLLKGFRSQKGIYKPAGSPYALWVRETLRSPYSDEVSVQVDRPDGSWLYRYSPEGRGGVTDMTLPTNRALLRCQKDGVPIGVLRQTSDARGAAAYEVLGLAYVTAFDGTHFLLRGEPIRWEDVTPSPPA